MKSFSHLLFFSGAFNIVLATPLIVPGLTDRYFAFLWEVNEALGLSGKEPTAPLNGINALLVNTAGIDLVLIGVIVFYAGFDPTRRVFIPLVNAIGRTLFAIIVFYYVFVWQIAGIVALIAAVDLLISAGFLYFIFRLGLLKRSRVDP